jgi:hypothetical protein
MGLTSSKTFQKLKKEKEEKGPSLSQKRHVIWTVRFELNIHMHGALKQYNHFLLLKFSRFACDYFWLKFH